MIIVGLTGSIGTGKTTTASMFLKCGVPVHDSDAAVSHLYKGKAVQPIEKAFPGSTQNGQVNRMQLAHLLTLQPKRLKALESIVHPMVDEEIQAFIARHQKRKTGLIVLESPLLFERKWHRRVERILVTTVSRSLQKERVFARPTMTQEKFDMLMENQITDEEKQKHADYVLNTECSRLDLERKVKKILDELWEIRKS